ncbi:hypothetical protein EW026_g6199 [Hermanssonia centrifuga]|uniref:Glucose-methanol-choline oxidoreductase N-terminal domain-containing protein n=1 Tax=Hermanssonia centrifuga TaxID=98765 RepID=A0A4S4KCQ6_9APHY|nr:hypothetical protein EW026_g6199 [Hermanssonia centrifuga]
MPSSIPEYDIIFAGGGTASCVTAGRLADADPSLRILIVEAGPHTQENLAHTQPARYLSHLAPTTKTMRFVIANPEPELDGRQTIVPCGQCVGGGSSVNFMMYARASASDYDDWEAFGNLGWGSKDIIPLLKKTESYELAPGNDAHGYSGPLKVSYGGAFTNIGKDYLAVAAAYDPKRGVTDDPNGLYEGSINKYARWQKWIDPKTGKRQDVPHQYLYNKDHQNVTIQTGSLVKRVIIEDKTVVGVEYVQNPSLFPDANGEVTIARAKRLVVVSSGSLGTPCVLERSGIGAKSILQKHGIEQIVDLPGVGENYHGRIHSLSHILMLTGSGEDHQVVFPPYLASEESETIDAIVRNEGSEIDKWTSQWLNDGTGLMSSNALDAGIKFRPSEEELKVIGPAFEKRWKEHFANAPDKPVMWMGSISMMVGDISIAPARKYFSMCYFLDYPSSTGFVHINSATDPSVPPEFETGFLKQSADLEVLKWAYKRTREYARRMACFRGLYAPNHPQFAENSLAARKDEVLPAAIDAPDIVYSEEDDKAVETYIRKVVATSWHSMGTCAMKPRELGGVVDSKLNVYGLKGLKLTDLSIAPSNVGANTYSTAMVIGEKAAVIIADELGIKNI